MRVNREFIMRHVILVLLLIAGSSVISVPTVSATEVSRVEFASHNINLTLDVSAHRAHFTDSGSVAVNKGWNLFCLNTSATVESLTLADRPVEYRAVTLTDSSSLPPEIASYLVEFEADISARLVLFESDIEGVHPFAVKYSAEFFEDVSKTRFSRERIGSEVSATILEQGAYLSSGAYYYPVGDESLAGFALTADIPEAWESISDGNRLSSEVRDGRKIQSWENPFKSDGCMFMAAPYVTRSTWVDSVEVACYFFEADTSLFEDYLTATVDYIRMYSDLIGPYPFKRFTVAENFFSTGYGMPAWTLLGQRVLRLPFIIGTSLGHEVLHNWWGNSVYVDYERGNWCEGSTVYGADYRYKLMQSPEAAKSYRKDILKQYLAYVDEGNDFPVREFTSRSSPNTRSIGYGKAMMVFHMIEEEIGTEAFFDAWKLVYKRHIGQKISWEEWIAAFGKTSRQDLSYVIPQWIDRAGAPVIELDVQDVAAPPPGETRSVEFSLQARSGEDYRLLVPLRFTGPDILIDTEILLTSPRQSYSISVPEAVATIEVDPDYHLFRRLHPEEVEPIVSAIMGQDDKRFICDADNAIAVKPFAAFGQNLSEDSVGVDGYDLFKLPDRAYVPIMLNPAELPEYLSTRVTITGDVVTVQGAEYPRTGHTFVLTGEKHDGFDKFMVIITDDFESLPRIGQLVPHYGKYSYLVFKGARNVGKGQWKVESSPLKVTLQ